MSGQKHSAEIVIDEKALQELREILDRLVGPTGKALELDYEDYTVARTIIALETYLSRRMIKSPFTLGLE